MCDPLTAASIALSAGGTFMEAREANKNAKRVQNARDNAFEAGQIRQRKHVDEAGAAFGQSTDKQGREQFDEQKTNEADNIKNAFADRRVQPDYNIGLASSAPKNVVLARKSSSDKAAAETDRDVNAFSNLNGYGGAMFNQDLARSAFGRAFGNIQSAAGADARLLPGEINAAGTNASKSPSLFPTLLRASGQGLGAFGAAGGSFTNTVEGAMPTGVMGPGAPVTQYGIFTNGKPMQAFGSQLVF